MNLRVGAVRTTILTAFARAAVLSRPPQARGQQSPPQGNPKLIDDDVDAFRYLATPKELESVLPLPDKKGKKKGSEKDTAREAIMTKMVSAEALIKLVFVRHPNYDDIVAAFLEGGLEGLERRVPLSVGTSQDQ